MSDRTATTSFARLGAQATLTSIASSDESYLTSVAGPGLALFCGQCQHLPGAVAVATSKHTTLHRVFAATGLSMAYLLSVSR